MSAASIIAKLKTASLFAAAAESCSAGLLADSFAQIPGASSVFWGSFVTYTNDAKEKMLGLPRSLLESAGAVSSAAARAMAEAALKKSGVDIAVSVTGLAGPDGDGSDNPVGTVWIAAAVCSGETSAQQFFLKGSRAEIRAKAVHHALVLLEECVDKLVKDAKSKTK